MQIEEDRISITLHAPYSNRAHRVIWRLALARLPVDRRCHGTQTVHQLADTDHISQTPPPPPPGLRIVSVVELHEWLRVNFKPRMMTSCSVALGTVEKGAGHSHLWTWPQHYKSVQVTREEMDGEWWKKKNKMWKAWWEIMTGYQDLSPPFICRHKHSIYHSASAQTALR